MCVPPFCHPAHHCLGCLKLRSGALIVLAGDLLYGIMLVVLHGVLLGSPSMLGEEEVPEGYAEMLAEELARGESHAMGVASAERLRRRLTEAADDAATDRSGSWPWQLMDLSIGWGHQILGVDNRANETFGLLYGIATVAICVLAIYATLHGASWLASVSRYTAAFMHIQIALLGGMALAKLPTLCTTQVKYMSALSPETPEHCNEAFRFMFMERTVAFIVVASLCTWIYSSFAFVLTFGPDAHFIIDHPDHTHALHSMDAERAGKPPLERPESSRDALVGASVKVGPGAADGAPGAKPSQSGGHHSHHQRSHHHNRHHQSHHHSHHHHRHSHHRHRDYDDDEESLGGRQLPGTSYRIGLGSVSEKQSLLPPVEAY